MSIEKQYRSSFHKGAEFGDYFTTISKSNFKITNFSHLRNWLRCEIYCYQARFNRFKDNNIRKLFTWLINSKYWWVYNELPNSCKPALHLYVIGSNQSSFVTKEVILDDWWSQPNKRALIGIFTCPVRGSYECEILNVA
jgi:hypothetical protein